MSCPTCAPKFARLRALMLALHERALRAESNLAEASTLLQQADRGLDEMAKKRGVDSETIDRELDDLRNECHAIH